MNYEELIQQKHPGWTKYAVKSRAEKYAYYDTILRCDIANITVSVTQAVEYLDVKRIGAPFKFLTYGEVCAYAWDLANFEGFDAVIAVAKRFGLNPVMTPPEDTEDLIIPSAFYGYLWSVFKHNQITHYSELIGRTLLTHGMYHSVSTHQKNILSAHGVRVTSEVGQLLFAECETSGYLAKFEADGFVVIRNYEMRKAELAEAEIKRVYPEAELQFDRRYGVIIK